MTEESRKFTRIPFTMHTEMRVNGKKYKVEEITNLSVGGCLLPLDLDFSPGTECTITITLEGTTDNIAVAIDGEVVRSVPQGIAVKFVRIDPESLFHLQNIIRYNSPDADTIESEIQKHPGIR